MQAQVIKACERTLGRIELKTMVARGNLANTLNALGDKRALKRQDGILTRWLGAMRGSPPIGWSPRSFSA